LTEGELNPAGQNPNNSLSNVVSSPFSTKGYTNPVGNWSPSRIDMGVDGTLAGSYVAPADSIIIDAETSDPGWAGGGYISGRIVSGPLKGKIWYVAEGIAPVVHPGAKVGAGTTVGRPAVSPYGNSYGKGAVGAIETGWANPAATREPLARALPGFGGDQSGQAIACGNSFNRWLIKLGASPGSLQGAGLKASPATMPPGYP
jgi:hypothetical protein